MSTPGACWPRLGTGGRLIVASADQVPPDGDLSFCRSIAEVVEQYG